MIYDVIIIGAGAAGLFAAASARPSRNGFPIRGLILEKSPSPGKKLLMAGSGQCNLTHSGDIKAFVSCYGDSGPKIRSILYRFNNLAVRDFFERLGVPLAEREDGKVFPASLCGRDVLDALLRAASDNGFTLQCSSPVTDIAADGSIDAAGLFTVTAAGKTHRARMLVVATGGCSYPTTGSDGSMFPLLEKLGHTIVQPKPALVPLCVENYPYTSLAGVAFKHVRITIDKCESLGPRESLGPLLLTHENFSGPAVLDLSRYARIGAELSIDYLPGVRLEDLARELRQAAIGSKKQIATVIAELPAVRAACGTDGEPALPKRFLEAVTSRAGAGCAGGASFAGGVQASSLPGSMLKAIAEILKKDRFTISGDGGFKIAMATAGGVPLEEISTRSLESKIVRHLFIIGEALDVDGNTGGYNLQFAFSSGHLAAESFCRQNPLLA